jgi:hypothetical protein
MFCQEIRISSTKEEITDYMFILKSIISLANEKF